MKSFLRSAALGALLLFSQTSLAAPVAEDDSIYNNLVSVGTEDLTPAAIAGIGGDLKCDEPAITSMCKYVCACPRGGGVVPIKCEENPQCLGKNCKCLPGGA